MSDKKWSSGTPCPAPRWFQVVSYHVSETLHTVAVMGAFFFAAVVFADHIEAAWNIPVILLAWFFLGTMQVLLWVLGDDIRKEKQASDKQDDDGMP